jgi:hypothetical protein
MAMLGRLLLRFILVPLGLLCAVLVATVVLLCTHWDKFSAMVGHDPHASASTAMNVLLFGPAVVVVFMVGTLIALLPAVLSVIASEIFAIRSWIFHVVSGGAWMGIGRLMQTDLEKSYEVFDDPLRMVIAGLVAGLVYWLVAGWNAGFWKPVLRPAAPA